MASPFQIPGLSTLNQAENSQTPKATENTEHTTSIATTSVPVATGNAPVTAPGDLNNGAEQNSVSDVNTAQNAQQDITSTVNDGAMDVDGQSNEETAAKASDATEAPASPPSLTEGLEALIGGLDPTPAQADLASAPATHETEADQNAEMRDADAADGGNEEGEGWEADSSPYESSSDSSSSDDSDDDSDDDNELLKPEEMARILMEAASDDEGDGKTKGSASGGLRTKNEMPEEVVPRPDVIIKPEMQLHVLGEVEHVVDSAIVIKAYTSGEYQVLDSGSVLCTEDRTVVAALADLIGSVREPRYMAMFKDAEELKTFNIEVGTKIFYTMELSTFVFTEPLKGMKGTDASNLNDEELNDDEMEFSDDEKEIEYKKEQKAKRNARSNARGGGDGTHGGRGGRGGRQDATPAPANLKYDDEDDGPYRPLTRPANFGQGGAPPAFTGGSTSHDGGSHRGGRGGRGRGRGNNARGNRGGQRHQGAGYSQQPQSQGYPSQQPQQQQQMPFWTPPPPHVGAAQGFVPPPPPQFFGAAGGQAPMAPFTWPQQPQNLPANFVPPPPPQFQQYGQNGQPAFPPAFFTAMQNQAQAQAQAQYQAAQNAGNQQQTGQFPPPSGSG
ncbi:hypothetical protein PFICI_04709 [Pestalotiopsis fici W106-1]|uniref:H/ACA ribonucleoprotein complex non-core subunit NAF1 n=1 Tax=Pestalotiopsis fici (strain W106-1 / CGMCC3.15140) TaxID=1229662 RepID=W3X9P4_PESFW|nr:uncharacterized protein PFICI_04709 [Pestalotiopsis fici W106-1]ETS82833.1 hypothetical protein PFICI_04709 [Pestalotiopsis fici W106-1]